MAKTSKPKGKLKLWITGARLRTLPLAIAPVALGAASAKLGGHLDLVLTALALAVALFLQIGVNFANDYSDGIRGTDADRVGPLRLTGSKSVAPKQVLVATAISFAAAAAAGLAITVITGFWWFIALGVICIAAAWFYTGGKNPYGYLGLGELAVLVFFGLVAVNGTAYIQEKTFSPFALIFSVSAGLFACAVLMVNNIRDIETDRKVQKRTLAVKLGHRASRIIFDLMLLVPMVLNLLVVFLLPAALIGWAVLLLILPTILIVHTAQSAKELILALKLSSFAALGYALLILLATFI